MNLRKRVAALIMKLIIITLAACTKEGDSRNVSTENSNTEVQLTATPTVTPIVTPTQVVTVAPTKAVVDSTTRQSQEIRDIPSTDLVKEIKIGWNLGNTMDATGGGGISSEISWGYSIIL